MILVLSQVFDDVYNLIYNIGSEISVFYDPLICKVITFAKTRDVAIEKMKMALKNSILLGPQTNRNFLVQVLSHPDFCSGKFDTNFIALNFPEKVLKQFDFEKVQNLATIALLWDWLQRRGKRTTLRHITPGWRNNRYKKQEVTFMFKRDKSKKLTIGYQYMSAEGEKIPKFKIQIENKILMLQLLKWNKEDGYVTLECSTNGVRNKYFVAQNENEFHVQSFNTGEFVFIKKSPLDVISESESVQTSGTIVAGLPGNVFKVLVNNGAMVKKGEPIIVLESMKMEHKMFAEKDGIVEILVKQGQLVKPDQLLARIK
jgi:propionyl-CoA carboxylase alpha chain